MIATPDGTEVGRVGAPKPLTRAQSRLRAAQRRAPGDAVPTIPRARRTGSPRTVGSAPRPGSGAFMRWWPRSGRMRSTRPPRRWPPATRLSRSSSCRPRTWPGAAGSVNATWYGTTLVTAPRCFPSTQLCSRCGAKTKLRLCDRVYQCRNGCPPIDRDLNAAITLAPSATPLLGERGPVPAVGPSPTTGMEMDVEPSRGPAPPPLRARWGRQEVTKRQPRTQLTREQGLLLREEKLPEMPSVIQTLTFQVTVTT